jgi:murein DD-endopeptidase MepM/ murein hydrolase activator NlpD
MDLRRHAPLGRRRSHLALQQPRGRPRSFLGRTDSTHFGIYTRDHADARQGGRFRWLLSTCLAAGVGVLAILVAIAGSSDSRDGEASWLPCFKCVADAPLPRWPLPSAVDGLRWAVPKVDKLLIPSGATATRSLIRDPVRQRRGSREYIFNKPYIRLAARLAPISQAQARLVPPLNPYKLYANTAPLDQADREEDGVQEARVKITDLLEGALLAEDGQELDNAEVAELVARSLAAEGDPRRLTGDERLSPGELLAERALRTNPDQPPPNTSILQKTVFEGDDAVDEIANRDVRVIKAQRGDTLLRILARFGAETNWQTRAMADAARSYLQDGALPAGWDVHVTLVPSAVRPGRSEPVRYSLFTETQEHKVTVMRNAAGEFVASATPVDERIARVETAQDDQPPAFSLYASIHTTAQRQGIPAEVIMQILKIHAYETDFRQRVRAGDAVEFFFDLKAEDEKDTEGAPGELLASSITASGETHRYYRYRTQDGTVDYYDERGNTSRKFLMRRPVRGEDVRLTSGFGLRRHPILLVAKMHTGVDWACAPGTPIMAAGNGVIEEAGRKGEYGNYVRIRHANGYKTAYGHMSGFAAGMKEGIKVRQGQVIGFVGTTGMSSGPHVHFEVLVKSSNDASYSHVDPMSIQVPRERQLAGKDLNDFHKERVRIEELMRRNPVSTRVATAGVR